MSSHKENENTRKEYCVSYEDFDFNRIRYGDNGRILYDYSVDGNHRVYGLVIEGPLKPSSDLVVRYTPQKDTPQ